MKAWVRIRGVVHSRGSEECRAIIEATYTAGLDFLVYPNEAKAREAAGKFGGFVVELDLRELRGMLGADNGNFETLANPSEADDLSEVHEDERHLEDPHVSVIVEHTATEMKGKREYKIEFQHPEEEAWAWAAVEELATVTPR